jgi:hypothetical protein
VHARTNLSCTARSERHRRAMVAQRIGHAERRTHPGGCISPSVGPCLGAGLSRWQNRAPMGTPFFQNTCAFFARDRNNCWIVTVCDEIVGRGRVEGMMGPGDLYRLELLTCSLRSQGNLRPRLWPRLVEEADRKPQRGLPLDPNDPAARHQRQQQPPQAAATTNSGTRAPSAG